MRNLLMSLGVLALSTICALSHEYKIGDLTIDHPVARATPDKAPVSAGYMTIRNNGSAPDYLIGGTVEFATKTEIHEMAMDGEVMRMRELADGLEIPAGGEVKLMPGGYHVMFMDMTEQLSEGDMHPIELVFRNAGTIEVMLHVEPLTKIRESMGVGDMEMDHSGHDHSGHDHSGHGNAKKDGMKSN